MTVGAGIARTASSGNPSLAEALSPAEILHVQVDLPSGRRVSVPTYVRDELRWSGELSSSFDAVPNKEAFTLDGTPMYPELLVVRLLEQAGWTAAWRKNWGGTAYWRDIREPITPAPIPAAIIEQVSRQAGHAIPWDIVAWRGREIRLLVSRVDSGRRVSAYLASWLDAALRMGIPLGCFAIVEHRAESRSRPGQPRPFAGRRRAIEGVRDGVRLGGQAS
jgi:hypothetical protein